MESAYLLVNFFTIIVPLLFSFHPKIRFNNEWRAVISAILITACIFIVWDIYFTNIGVWGFNPAYLTGIEIFNLPLEEVLFFICIPYACVFTYYCITKFLDDLCQKRTELTITVILIVILSVLGILFYKNIYTATTFFSLAAVLAASKFVFKIEWLGKFYIVSVILLLPFLVVNGILTGTGLNEPIVWYNETEIIGIRLGTIPFEDIFYGMELILVNLLLYKYFKTF